MAASPTSVPSPKTDGGNALAALLAAAAASMHRQQQLQQQPQLKDQNQHHHAEQQHQKHQQQLLQQQQQQQHQQHQLNQLHLLLGNSKTATEPTATTTTDHVELRNLESWHDEDGGPIDDNCLQELVDPSSNSNGWSADEMFKYNEKMHKITTSYNEKTLSDNYTTPLPRMNSKTTMRLATQLAREIEERVIAEGRVTPESSDDDELFENERNQRIQLKQRRQLDQLKELQLQLQQQHRFTMLNNNNTSKTSRTQSSSKHSNSTETPATASLSSSPTLNEPIIKPVTSSSRNILRTCLT